MKIEHKIKLLLIALILVVIFPLFFIGESSFSGYYCPIGSCYDEETGSCFGECEVNPIAFIISCFVVICVLIYYFYIVISDRKKAKENEEVKKNGE